MLISSSPETSEKFKENAHDRQLLGFGESVASELRLQKETFLLYMYVQQIISYYPVWIKNLLC